MKDDVEFTLGEKVGATCITLVALALMITGIICVFEWLAE